MPGNFGPSVSVPYILFALETIFSNILTPKHELPERPNGFDKITSVLFIFSCASLWSFRLIDSGQFNHLRQVAPLKIVPAM